jgi:hypothetical protein
MTLHDVERTTSGQFAIVTEFVSALKGMPWRAVAGVTSPRLE